MQLLINYMKIPNERALICTTVQITNERSIRPLLANHKEVISSVL